MEEGGVSAGDATQFGNTGPLYQGGPVAIFPAKVLQAPLRDCRKQPWINERCGSPEPRWTKRTCAKGDDGGALKFSCVFKLVEAK
jgi:hypothetical protein